MKRLAAFALAALAALPLAGCLPVSNVTVHRKDGLAVAGGGGRTTVRYCEVDVTLERIHDPNSGTWQALAGVDIVRDGGQCDRSRSTVTLTGRDFFTDERQEVRTCTLDDATCILQPDHVDATVLHWEAWGVMVELWSNAARCRLYAWSQDNPNRPVERRC